MGIHLQSTFILLVVINLTSAAQITSGSPDIQLVTSQFLCETHLSGTDELVAEAGESCKNHISNYLLTDAQAGTVRCAILLSGRGD